MHRVLRALIPILAVLVVILAAGFSLFIYRVAQHVTQLQAAADAVVVLTGGEGRIGAAVDLVATRRGNRLLITGVNPKIATVQELGRKLGGSEQLYRCCIDLGYGALDTAGNADEAREWTERWGFRSLIIVTSSYHMPRTLAEFARAMPDVLVLPHAVPSRQYKLEIWWRHLPTARLLVGEYLKYLTAVTRLGLARLAGPFQSASLAGRPQRPDLSAL